MDSHTGSAVDDGIGVVEKHVVQELDPNAANNGTPSAEDGDKVPESNGIPGNEAKADGEQEASEAKPCQETKVSISAKFQKSDAKTDGNNDSKAKKKSTEAQSNSKGAKTALIQNHKSSLTESLSFPSKGPRGSVLRKSVGASPLMTRDKQSRKNGRRSSDVNPSLNASLPRTLDLNNSDGKTTNQVNSNESKNGDVNKHTSATSKPTIQQSKSAKSGSSDNANGLASLLTVQRPKDSEPVKESSPNDMNDAKSTSATNDQRARRNSVSGFVFRSNERAEKRKEFNMKIEEKISAKEAEKCNLQARSKESQEAEIKQLRKSLTFKATPLPSFYNEPPPNVELKKIPTTRPISPKLGRSKTSSRTKNAQVDGSFGSLQIVSDLPKSANLSHLDKSIDLNSKKVIQKSQAKIQSRESGAVNKPASKSRIKNGGETENEKASIEKNKEEEPTDTHPQSSSDCVGNTQDKDNVEEFLIPDNGMITGAAAQREAIPNEIIVGG